MKAEIVVTLEGITELELQYALQALRNIEQENPERISMFMLVTAPEISTERSMEILKSIKPPLPYDLSLLDKAEPDHSPHDLINYIHLPNYKTGQSYWWCKLHRKVIVHTGAQANRVIKHALAVIDDAIAQALIDRDARKAHMSNTFPD